MERQLLTNYSILATTYGSDGKVWSFVVIQKAPRLRRSRITKFYVDQRMLCGNKTSQRELIREQVTTSRFLLRWLY